MFEPSPLSSFNYVNDKILSAFQFKKIYNHVKIFEVPLQ